MGKIILVALVSILLINFVSATIDWDIPRKVAINSNFDIEIKGIGLYAIEIIMPPEFTIVSDPSNGIISEGIYRTSYAAYLKITLRVNKKGIYDFLGKYTEGSGVKSFPSAILEVYELSYSKPPTCPTCPLDSEWSNCANEKQVRIVYNCSVSTEYICKSFMEERNCEMPKETCEVGVVCQNEEMLAYQSSDCSLATLYRCDFGCENNECKPNPNLENKKNENQEQTSQQQEKIIENIDNNSFPWIILVIVFLVLVVFVIFIKKLRR